MHIIGPSRSYKTTLEQQLSGENRSEMRWIAKQPLRLSYVGFQSSAWKKVGMRNVIVNYVEILSIYVKIIVIVCL